MKKLKMIMMAALLVCGVAKAAQDTNIDQREVRDPRKLETYLEANASDAQSRLAALETSTSSVAMAAYDVSGFTNGVLASGRLPAMYQADTNTTTAPTTYTPGFIGQPLFGSEGSSSRVWFATAANTNGWTLKFNAD